MTAKTESSWKYRIGMVFVFIGMFMPVLALIVPMLDLNTTLKTILISVLVVGGPEVFLVIGAVLAGKKGIEVITTKIKAVFKGKPKPVGKRRYQFGIFMLIAGLFLPVLVFYEPDLIDFQIPEMTTHYIGVTCDVIVIASFFVLGSQFWAKLQKLFTWESEV